MKLNIKHHIIFPIILMIGTAFLYALYLWSTNFTPRMIFYFEDVVFEQIEPNIAQFAFISEENYLGIISFSDVGRYIDLNAGVTSISLLENEYLIHTNNYNANDFINRVEFPFGFPIQESSMDKEYVVRFEQSCYDLDECSFNPKEDEIMVRHYLPKSYIVRNLNLVLEKITNNLIDQGLFKNAFIFIFPVSLYFFLISFFSSQVKRIVSEFKKFLLNEYNPKENLHYFFVFSDVLFSSNTYFFLFLFLVLLLFKLKVQSSRHFLFRAILILYSISLTLTILQIGALADRVSIWVFVYFVLYIFNNIIGSGIISNDEKSL